MRRADRSPLKFNAKLSEPLQIVPTRLQALYCDPAEYTLLKALTFRTVIQVKPDVQYTVSNTTIEFHRNPGTADHKIIINFSVLSFSIDMDSSEQLYDLAPLLQIDPLWTENYDSDMTNLWDAQQLPICNELQ